MVARLVLNPYLCTAIRNKAAHVERLYPSELAVFYVAKSFIAPLLLIEGLQTSAARVRTRHRPMGTPRRLFSQCAGTESQGQFLALIPKCSP